MKRILILMTTILALAACKDWTQMEYIPTDINHPWEQDPSVWEAYTSSLQAYKQSGHTLVYARLANSPEPAVSEKNFMRCLPDSLDIVSLTNDFSRHDAEDMAMMKQKGTKVLLQVDALDEDPTDAVKMVKANGLDGWALTGTPNLDDASSVAKMAAVVKAVSEAKTQGQLLVFEGNPLFVAEADRAAFDLYVLDTDEMSAAMDVRLSVLSAENYGIPSIPDMVRENEWTMDAAIGITKEIYVDTDGNGTMDTNDTYGIVNGAWACADGYYTAADIHQIVIDEKGMPALVPQQERIAKLLETIAPFWLDPASAGAYCVWGGPEVDMFINNQTLLSAFELDAGVYSFRDMDASYTILPYPKLDDTQDYRTNATNGATLMAIPVDNTERLDASCAAMEAIAAYNHLNIVDIYIETCLQEKFARNEDTVDMLNLIRESICMDVEHMFKAVLGETMYVVRDLLIDSKNTNIASWYASKTTGIESAIQSTIATIEEMQ